MLKREISMVENAIEELEEEIEHLQDKISLAELRKKNAEDYLKTLKKL